MSSGYGYTTPALLSPADYADHLIHALSQVTLHPEESSHAIVSLLGLFPTPGCPSPIFLSLKSDNAERVVPELRKCKGYLKGEWEEIAGGRVKALVYLGRGGECRNRGDVENEREELHKAYEAYESSLTAYLRHLTSISQEVSARPYLPVLTQMLEDLRQLAQLADRVATTTSSSAPTQPHLEATARQLNKAFTVCVADRNQNMTFSRKWATYKIVNLLFRTYFKLKSLPLCRNILRALSAAPLPSFESFPAADRVTFKYYTGQLHFLSQDWSLALQDLEYAWRYCHRRAVKQQYLILLYLLPLRLILQGRLPEGESIWNPHPTLRALYEPFFTSIREGDLELFHKTLTNPQHEKFLVQHGLYAAVESFRPILLQSIMKRLYTIKEKSTRVSLKEVEKTLAFAGQPKQDEEEEEDDDEEEQETRNKAAERECEWLVAGLIAKGFVKGYISHERQILVLSNKEPFPRISSVGMGVAL